MTDSEEMETTLGEIIRQQRELAALPMRQLASMVGISNPYLSQIEHGLREPSDQVLEGIAKSLRTSVDDLLGRSRPDVRRRAVLDAVADDPGLTAAQRRALTEVYQSMIAATAAKKTRRATD